MKPNEIIGLPAFIGVFFFIGLSAYTGDIKIIGFAMICAFIQLIFLSWWGLETFNGWFNK